MQIIFAAEKATKNTVRFAEVLASETGTPKVGTVYVPKTTLTEMGFKDGQKLVLEFTVQE